MDLTCLNYRLSADEQERFDTDGFFIVHNVLPRDFIRRLIQIIDRIDAENRPIMGLGLHQSMNVFDIIGRNELLLELVDWPQTFPKVFGILG